MCAPFNKSQSRGFTLIELLVVMVVMGLVVTSIYSLFVSSQRTSYTSEEVSDVQQNLRFAVDTLVSDIRMAGFLIPHDQSAVVNAPADIGAGEFLVLQTRSSLKSYARVISENADGLTVENPMAASFRAGDTVRLVRPGISEVIGSWTINEIDNGLLKLAGYALSGASAGDVVVRKLVNEAENAAMIAEIRYWLRPTAGGGTNNFELVRGDGNADSVVASNISALTLTYIMDDGGELPTTNDVDRIRAIRIAITGQTDNTRTGMANISGVKTRSLQTVAKIRNAFGG